MRLLVQPEDGIQPLIDALNRAKKSIQILIFRLDRAEVELALVEAARRGVAVTALIAHTNRGGEKFLRRFEARLLDQGVTVARTADDLVRYHGKMFVVDGKELFLLAFNYTHLDIALSRSFAAVIRDKDLVHEARRLFEADMHRLPYVSQNKDLLVSPENARERLLHFIHGAKKQLLIYEMKLSDTACLRALQERMAAGVDLRVMSRGPVKNGNLPVRIAPMRLHARAMVRDGRDVFLGSMSMRKLELDARREVGVTVRNTKAARRMREVFDADWAAGRPAVAQDLLTAALEAPAKKVAKLVARRIAVKPVVEDVLDRMLDTAQMLPFEPEQIAQTVREALREEIHDAVVDALREVVVGEAARPAPTGDGGQ